jgi:hypothetical protein
MTDPCKWTRPVAALALLLAAGPALADWQRLDGDGIAEVLSGAVVDYDGAAWQEFLASGLTLYRVGEAPSGDTSRGDWRADGGNYCSRWPPGEDWTCYAVEVDGTGGIRFIDSWGNISAGHFVTEPE